MTWLQLPPALRQAAEQLLTPNELAVLKLRHAGMSQTAIALATGRSRSTIRNLEHRAHQKLAPHITEETA